MSMATTRKGPGGSRGGRSCHQRCRHRPRSQSSCAHGSGIRPERPEFHQISPISVRPEIKLYRSKYFGPIQISTRFMAQQKAHRHSSTNMTLKTLLTVSSQRRVPASRRQRRRLRSQPPAQRSCSHHESRGRFPRHSSSPMDAPQRRRRAMADPRRPPPRRHRPLRLPSRRHRP
jgi:hypothetical protein